MDFRVTPSPVVMKLVAILSGQLIGPLVSSVSGIGILVVKSLTSRIDTARAAPISEAKPSQSGDDLIVTFTGTAVTRPTENVGPASASNTATVTAVVGEVKS